MSGPTEDMVDAVLGELCSRFDDVGCVEADDPETWDDIRKTCVGLVTAIARTSVSGPMDPERLASVRAHIERKFRARGTAPFMCELLDDRDHWEAEATRYRSRCPVTAEDVKAAGVTRGQMDRYLHGTFRCERTGDRDGTVNWYMGDEWICWTSDSMPIEGVVMKLAECGDAAFDILDEMAAMNTGAAEVHGVVVREMLVKVVTRFGDDEVDQ